MKTTEPVRWLLLTTSLTGRAASTARVRLWRTLKDLGVGSLRDGVSLLPAGATHRAALAALVAEVAAEGGSAWLLELPAQPPAVESALVDLFDRGSEYEALADIERIDFFPGPAREQARAAFAGLESAINRRFSPEEPSPGTGKVRRLDIAAFQGRLWATRRRLWVDRAASAWLIRRFIDPEARFFWFDTPAACPVDVLGFDFDGATFSHLGDKVTFEVLLASFGLDADAGLSRLGRLVHYLDVGGLPVAEAAGFEAVLAGLRDAAPDDDALLAAATPLLDALYRTYSGARA